MKVKFSASFSLQTSIVQSQEFWAISSDVSRYMAVPWPYRHGFWKYFKLFFYVGG